MQKINFSVSINAPKSKVWSVLWDDATYGKWTAPFAEGSRAITDWKEGSKVLFVSGSGDGMVSCIETKRENEYMSIKHLGMIKDGIEDTTSDKVKAWNGALENYTLQEKDGVTTLAVDMDITEEHKDYFMQTWPKALEVVKSLSE
jgi:hypothetical protein